MQSCERPYCPRARGAVSIRNLGDAPPNLAFLRPLPEDSPCHLTALCPDTDQARVLKRARTERPPLGLLHLISSQLISNQDHPWHTPSMSDALSPASTAVASPHLSKESLPASDHTEESAAKEFKPDARFWVRLVRAWPCISADLSTKGGVWLSLPHCVPLSDGIDRRVDCLARHGG